MLRVCVSCILFLLLTSPLLSQVTAQDEKFARAAEVLVAAIEEKAFPGCAVAVGTDQGVLWSRGFGHFAYDDTVARDIGLSSNPAVTKTTVYDLASLTKVVSTTSTVMACIRDGKLRLDDKVADIIPEFTQADTSPHPKSAITVEQLLVHGSGLPAWKAFYKEHSGYRPVLAAVAATPLESARWNRISLQRPWLYAAG